MAVTSQKQEVRHSIFVDRSPVFYGWVVWVVSTLAVIASSPGQTYSVSLFTEHFIADLGVSRTTVSSLYGLGTFIASLSMTWVGRQIDRHGNRKVGAVIAGTFALVLAGLSMVSSPVGLLLGFVAIRMLGQGSMTIIGTTSIAEWFRSLRGRMVSLAMVCFMLFQSFYIRALQSFIESYGWRMTWVALGVGMGAIVLPAIVIFMRRTPETFGLLPDGETHENALERERTEVNKQADWSLREAMTTPIFWIFLFGEILPPTWITGLIFHHVSIFQELGYEADAAARLATNAFANQALVAVVAALVTGALLDRVRSGYVIALKLVALAAVLFLATVLDQSALLPVYAVALGVVMGSGSVFSGAIWPNLFGRLHQGTIRGFTTMVAVIGASIGPVIFAQSIDRFGSYTAALFLGLGLAVVAALMGVFMDTPRRRIEPERLTETT